MPSGGVEEEIVLLPWIKRLTSAPLEEVLLMRRSARSFTEDPVELRRLGLILWAAYGVTAESGLRTVPSAGATYPLNLYVVAGEGGVVREDKSVLPSGVYRYDALRHVLVLRFPGDLRRRLQEAALKQLWVGQAPVSLVITAVYSRTTSIYGERGRERYVPMEVGHVSQNVYLMATALGYGTVSVGAFDDKEVSDILGLNADEVPLNIMPLGVPRRGSSLTLEDINRFFELARRRH